MTRLGIASLLVLGATRIAVAQSSSEESVRELGRVERELPDPFTRIISARELADGTVLVGDDRESVVKHVDFLTGRARVVGRKGQGPEEYGSVGELLAARGDSTWLVDAANGRLLVVAPTGAITGMISLLANGGVPATGTPRVAGTGPPRTLFLPSYVDSSGRLYDAAVSSRRAPGSSDNRTFWTHVIRRWDRSLLKADTVATFQTDQVYGVVGRVQMRMPSPFGLVDQWAVHWDGSVAIVRAKDYRIEWISPAGATVRGPSIPYAAPPVTGADKAERVQRQKKAALESRSGAVSRADPSLMLNDFEWPKFKPPFTGEVRMAPDGALWVPLTKATSADPLTYEIIDSYGRAVGRVRFPARTVLIGFGKKYMYTARADDDDLQYLQRRRIP